MKCLAVIVLAFALVAPARADVLYDNFGSTGAGFDDGAWTYASYTVDFAGLGILRDTDLLQNIGTYTSAYDVTTVELALARGAGEPDAAVVYLASGSPYPDTILATQTITGTIPTFGSAPYGPVSVDFAGAPLPVDEVIWVGVSTFDVEAQLGWHPTTGASTDPAVVLDITDGVTAWVDTSSTWAVRVNVDPERPVADATSSWGRVKSLF